MCEAYTACECLEPKFEMRKALSLLLLDCWQREYDCRPYRKFKLKRNDFEERYQRRFHPVKDFAVVVNFIQQRPLCSVKLIGFQLIACQHKILYDLAQSLQNLTVIELKLMEIPTEFFEYIRDNATKMKVKQLSLEGTPLLTQDIEALRLFLICSKSLEGINVGFCSVDQYNFGILADGMHKSTTLRAYDCSRILGNTLTLDSFKIAHIVSSLIWQNKLSEIEMQQCEFIAQDMEIIAEYLWRPESKLLKLNLANNVIGPDGVQYLLRAIAHSRTLIDLNISSNKLGSHGGLTVSKYLSSCFRLEYLNISYNDIGNDAINNILTTMKKPIKLMQLKLWGNHFNERSAAILKRLLDARVVPQDTIDVTVTLAANETDYRVIPWV